MIFDTYEEAKYYQLEYGGSISIVRKYEEQIDQVQDPLDFGLDVTVECVDKVVLCARKYFVLNIKDQTNLRNGFRYIKELLLQNHNF